MRDTKDRHDHVPQVTGKFRLAQTSRRGSGSSSLSGEARSSAAGLASGVDANSRQGVSDRELGEVNIDFGGVDGLSSELRQHLLGGNTSVVELGVFLKVDSVHLSSNGLEHSRTTTGYISGDFTVVEVDSRSRRAKDD